MTFARINVYFYTTVIKLGYWFYPSPDSFFSDRCHRSTVSGLCLLPPPRYLLSAYLARGLRVLQVWRLLRLTFRRLENRYSHPSRRFEISKFERRRGNAKANRTKGRKGRHGRLEGGRKVKPKVGLRISYGKLNRPRRRNGNLRSRSNEPLR